MNFRYMQNFIFLRLIKKINIIFINILNEYKITIINDMRIQIKIK